jgi:hypothetical protein
LSQRTGLILCIAVVSGIGVLTFFAEKSHTKAALAGVIAAEGCRLHSLID